MSTPPKGIPTLQGREEVKGHYRSGMDPTREAIRELAAQVVSGQLTPVEGAQQIAAQAAQLSDPGELGVFAELARTGAENAILEEVSLLLADTA
jgi:hypothetical protein